jgi:hypothetical protein
LLWRERVDYATEMGLERRPRIKIGFGNQDENAIASQDVYLTIFPNGADADEVYDLDRSDSAPQPDVLTGNRCKFLAYGLFPTGEHGGGKRIQIGETATIGARVNAELPGRQV